MCILTKWPTGMTKGEGREGGEEERREERGEGERREGSEGAREEGGGRREEGDVHGEILTMSYSSMRLEWK